MPFYTAFFLSLFIPVHITLFYTAIIFFLLPSSISILVGRMNHC